MRKKSNSFIAWILIHFKVLPNPLGLLKSSSDYDFKIHIEIKL